MKTPTLLMVVLASSLAISGSVLADEKTKGHGAGGVRADHASERGLEKGKAWAGSKEKKDKKDKKDKE